MVSFTAFQLGAGEQSTPPMSMPVSMGMPTTAQSSTSNSLFRMSNNTLQTAENDANESQEQIQRKLETGYELLTYIRCPQCKGRLVRKKLPAVIEEENAAKEAAKNKNGTARPASPPRLTASSLFQQLCFNSAAMSDDPGEGSCGFMFCGGHGGKVAPHDICNMKNSTGDAREPMEDLDAHDPNSVEDIRQILPFCVKCQAHVITEHVSTEQQRALSMLVEQWSVEDYTLKEQDKFNQGLNHAAGESRTATEGMQDDSTMEFHPLGHEDAPGKRFSSHGSILVTLDNHEVEEQKLAEDRAVQILGMGNGPMNQSDTLHPTSLQNKDSQDSFNYEEIRRMLNPDEPPSINAKGGTDMWSSFAPHRDQKHSSVNIIPNTSAGTNHRRYEDASSEGQNNTSSMSSILHATRNMTQDRTFTAMFPSVIPPPEHPTVSDGSSGTETDAEGGDQNGGYYGRGLSIVPEEAFAKSGDLSEPVLDEDRSNPHQSRDRKMFEEETDQNYAVSSSGNAENREDAASRGNEESHSDEARGESSFGVTSTSDATDAQGIVSSLTQEELQSIDRVTKRDIAAKAIGSKLVNGYKLTQVLCERCDMPLMDSTGVLECVICPVLMSDAKKRANEKRRATRSANMHTFAQVESQLYGEEEETRENVTVESDSRHLSKLKDDVRAPASALSDRESWVNNDEYVQISDANNDDNSSDNATKEAKGERDEEESTVFTNFTPLRMEVSQESPTDNDELTNSEYPNDEHERSALDALSGSKDSKDSHDNWWETVLQKENFDLTNAMDDDKMMRDTGESENDTILPDQTKPSKVHEKESYLDEVLARVREEQRIPHVSSTSSLQDRKRDTAPFSSLENEGDFSSLKTGIELPGNVSNGSVNSATPMKPNDMYENTNSWRTTLRVGTESSASKSFMQNDPSANSGSPFPKPFVIPPDSKVPLPIAVATSPLSSSKSPPKKTVKFDSSVAVAMGAEENNKKHFNDDQFMSSSMRSELVGDGVPWKETKGEDNLRKQTLRGWTILSQSCPGENCASVPLRSFRGGPPVCFICGKTGIGLDFGRPKIRTKPFDPEANSTTQVKHDSIYEKPLANAQHFTERIKMEFGEEPSVDRRRVEAGKEMSRRLQHGWTLTNAHCKQCIMPLMEKKGCDPECIICGYIERSEKVNIEKDEDVKIGAVGTLPIPKTKHFDMRKVSVDPLNKNGFNITTTNLGDIDLEGHSSRNGSSKHESWNKMKPMDRASYEHSTEQSAHTRVPSSTSPRLGASLETDWTNRYAQSANKEKGFEKLRPFEAETESLLQRRSKAFAAEKDAKSKLQSLKARLRSEDGANEDFAKYNDVDADISMKKSESFQGLASHSSGESMERIFKRMEDCKAQLRRKLGEETEKKEEKTSKPRKSVEDSLKAQMNVALMLETMLAEKKGKK